MTKKNPQAILCLVGPPGVGKTSLARSIAKALNRQFVKQALVESKKPKSEDTADLSWSAARPHSSGHEKAGTINPVFLLDEIDK